MRKLIVNEFISLDGVVQAGGGKEEDTDGGFRHGGWQTGYGDDVGHRWVLEYIEGAGGFLLGRRTYEIFAGYWPKAPEDTKVIAENLNTKPKYVATTTLSDPLEWQSSTVLRGDLAEAVTALKREDGGDVHVIGSAQLVRSLLEQDLVDELRLSIHPLTLGGGKGIFPADGTLRSLQLVGSEVTSTGVILATYARATSS
jgi:dihydrofolate reductase